MENYIDHATNATRVDNGKIVLEERRRDMAHTFYTADNKGKRHGFCVSF